MSAISELLMAQFWPSFIGGFLGPLWTYCNCQDIYPGNICSHQEYRSCYWPDFDQTRKVPETIINKSQLSRWHGLGNLCSGDICPYQASQLFLTKFWLNLLDPIFLRPYFFWIKYWFCQKLCLTQTFLEKFSGHNFLDPKFLLTQNFMDPNFFGP